MRPAAAGIAAVLAAALVAPASAQWAQTAGPTGGPIAGIAVHPTNGHVLAVGNNSLFRSTDGGVTWTSLFSGLPYDVQYSAVGFGATSAITGGAGGASNVVYRSVDDGVTWTQAANAGMPVASFNAFWYVGSKVLVGLSNGVYASTNNGDSWVPSQTGLPAGFAAGSFASDGVDLYVGSSAASGVKGVYRSTDGGATWTATNVTFLSSAYCAGIGANANGVFAATSTNGVWRTVDHGAMWTKVNTDAGSNFGSTLHATATNVWLGAGSAIYRADATGAGWSLVTIGLPPANAGNAVGVIRGVAGAVLAGVGKWGVYRMVDGGFNWAASNTGLRALKMNGLLASNGWLFAAADGLGFFRSNNGGSTWSPSSSGVPAYSGYFTFARTVDGSLLGGSSGSGQVFRSADDGATWTLSNANMTISNVFGFAVDNVAIYAGGYYGVCVSNDDGASWTTLPTGFTFTQTVLDVLKDGPYMLAGCNAGIKRSVDSGASWTAPMSGQPGSGSFYGFARVDTVLFMATTFGVYRSFDHGATWTSTTGPAAPYALVARNRDLWAGAKTGVYRSTDYGATWTAINDGLPVNLPVWKLAYDSQYLYAGGANTNVWRRPLPQVAAAPLAPATRAGATLAAGVPNPVLRDTRIGFTLPAAGRVRLDVVDATGRRVATLLHAALPAGAHSVRWDATREGGGRVAPGVYFVRLDATGARLARRLLVLE